MRLGPLLRRAALTVALLLTAGLASPAAALTGTGTGSDADGRIVFADDRTGNFQLYSIRPDGSGLRQLTNTAGHDNFNAAWSPDGRTIAFDSDRTGAVQIFTMRPDGTHVRQLTDDPARSSNPAWSPDGRRLAFVRRQPKPENGAIYVVNADGSGQRALTSDQADNSFPAWAPDGTQIAFTTRCGPTARTCGG